MLKTVMMAKIALLLTAAALGLAAPASLVDHERYPSSRGSWPGWSGIEHMFIFGDSYTTTGFEVNGTQPSRENPLGNPEYPGYTSSVR